MASGTHTSDAHEEAKGLAIAGILLYPVGVSVLYIVLFLFAGRAIASDHPTPLSEALGFLVRDYAAEYFWWELLEAWKKLLLVGFGHWSTRYSRAALRCEHVHRSAAFRVSVGVGVRVGVCACARVAHALAKRAHLPEAERAQRRGGRAHPELALAEEHRLRRREILDRLD